MTEKEKADMIELHVHLDGSLRPETIWELAMIRDGKAPAADLEGLVTLMQAPVPCSSLSEYLSRFALPLNYLQTDVALERVAFELTEDLAREGVEYAEIRFAPQLSTELGLSQMEVTEAVAAGVKRGMAAYPGIKAGLLLCCMRGSDEGTARNNMETLKTAADCVKDGEKGRIVCGVDLAGDESEYQNELFLEYFKKAGRMDIPLTVHAGECKRVQNIELAMENGAKRIGHGIAMRGNYELQELLCKKGIGVELCPGSNLQTGAVASAEEYPFREFLKNGVKISVNTDNRTVTNTTMIKELKFLDTHFGLSAEDAGRLMMNAIETSFAGNSVKEIVRKEISQWEKESA